MSNILDWPWQIIPHRQRVVDEWGYPKNVMTETVVAIDGTGRQHEISELGSLGLDNGLRRYLVNAHNGRLREVAQRAVESAKPKEYERIGNYEDLANIVLARQQQETMEKELERKGHTREAWESAGTRLPPEDVTAFEAMAKKLNVPVGLLYRSLLLNAAQEILAKEKSPAPAVTTAEADNVVTPAAVAEVSSESEGALFA